jgi:AcrR family transcriptional regulator
LRAADVLAEARVERAVFYRHFENVAALVAAVDAQRAGDDDRDDVLVVLVRATAAGLLDLDEFEHRVDAVLAADRWGELRALLADLPVIDPPR